MPGIAPRGAWHGRELPIDLTAPGKWRESEAWLFAVDLWNGGLAWEAWEVWEGLWQKARVENPLQGRFLQGLVKLAGALVHRERGREGADESLFREGLLLLRSVEREAGPVFMGLSLDGFISQLESGEIAMGIDRKAPPILLVIENNPEKA